MQPTLDNAGKYKADSGEMDDLAGAKGSLRLDPSSVPGLEQYQEGDEVMMEVKARLGAVGEDGMADFEIVRVKPKDMDYGSKVNRSRNPQVDPTGTAL